MDKVIEVVIVYIDGTSEVHEVLASSINEVRRDLNNDKTVERWCVAC